MKKVVIAIIIFLVTAIATAAIVITINERQTANRMREEQRRAIEEQRVVIDDESEPTENGEAPEEETPVPAGEEIILDSPQPEANVTSPLQISGRARGSWYFEATFPVVLTNWDGLIIAEGYATADGDWMTEDYVPFTAELEFEPQEVSSRGALILKKANPSGLPENDDALEITVYLEE